MMLLQIAGDAATTLSGFEEFQKMSVKLLVRLLIDLTAVFILVRFIYYPYL
jgi:hypothetical protein